MQYGSGQNTNAALLFPYALWPLDLWSISMITGCIAFLRPAATVMGRIAQSCTIQFVQNIQQAFHTNGNMHTPACTDEKFHPEHQFTTGMTSLHPLFAAELCLVGVNWKKKNLLIFNSIRNSINKKILKKRADWGHFFVCTNLFLSGQGRLRGIVQRELKGKLQSWSGRALLIQDIFLEKLRFSVTISMCNSKR